MAWTPPPPRPGHPFYMYDAIYAQPGAIRLVLRNNAETVRAAAAHLRGMERVFLSGIGTSWHACLVGELLLSQVGRLGHRVRAFHSFEFKNYWPDPDPRTGVIVVSHRGTKRFSLEALQKTKAGGGVGVVITGLGSGDGLKIADYTLSTVAQESSAAHTVSYTTALALLVALAAELGGRDEVAAAVEAIPDQMAFLLGQESWEELTARFSQGRRYYFVGGGPNTATAYEAALKMNEANYATTVGMNCEQVLHGPWAAMEAGDVVFLVAPPGPSYERCLALARAASEVGAPVVGIVQEGDRELSALCAETIALPPIPELLTPILAVVPLQLFTYHLAVRRGTNPDTMRGDQPAHGRARASFSL
ncbi:MAG: SIS domain-containing protein [Candidatus Rokubacteria bacterium]|nr:SIS domain-containing protein [Candidatus Rokubacteria bacterium]